MGTTTKTKKKKTKQRARKEIDYKAKSQEMLRDAYIIASSALMEARELTDAREKKGVGGWMHVAEKAIGEIIRLTPMCGDLKQAASPADMPTEFILPEYDDSLRLN
ncbi:MAG: hypothetical protein GY847_28980 [Proteobacteria bacterium]|nr:hypothetical protein [Pseudomonadota bacterium]